MPLKKHSLYNLNWSCFEHTVACANKPCCVVLQVYVYVKLSRNQYWVNLLFSVLRNSILDLFLDRLSLFSIVISVICVVTWGRENKAKTVKH